MGKNLVSNGQAFFRRWSQLLSNAHGISPSRYSKAVGLFTYEWMRLLSPEAQIHSTSMYHTMGIFRSFSAFQNHLKDCGFLHPNKQTLMGLNRSFFAPIARIFFLLKETFTYFMLYSVAYIISILYYENVHVMSLCLCFASFLFNPLFPLPSLLLSSDAIKKATIESQNSGSTTVRQNANRKNIM